MIGASSSSLMVVERFDLLMKATEKELKLEQKKDTIKEKKVMLEEKKVEIAANFGGCKDAHPEDEEFRRRRKG